MNILTISGSLRQASFNTALLRAGQQYMPKDCVVTVASLAGIPFYNADDEAAKGLPEAAQRLKAQIIAADGVLISTPEYNHGMPGVLKNAIDWCTRPPADLAQVFHHRKVGLMGASPGHFGTSFAQTGFLITLYYLRVDLYRVPFYVFNAHKSIDEKGEIIDETLQASLKQYIEGFVAFVKKG